MTKIKDISHILIFGNRYKYGLMNGSLFLMCHLLTFPFPERKEKKMWKLKVDREEKRTCIERSLWEWLEVYKLLREIRDNKDYCRHKDEMNDSE